MRPVVQGIPDKAGNRVRPREKFIVRLCVSGDKLFADAVGAHRPPFIMIAAQPHRGQIGKAAVFGNFLRYQMTMVIKNRFPCRRLMVEFLRCYSGK